MSANIIQFDQDDVYELDQAIDEWFNSLGDANPALAKLRTFLANGLPFIVEIV